MLLSLHPLGLAVGSVFSLVLFKRRMWPITFGLGENFYLQLGGGCIVFLQVLALAWDTTTVRGISMSPTWCMSASSRKSSRGR